MPEGALLAPDELARSQPDRVPSLGSEGAAQVRRAAQQMDLDVLNNYPRLLSRFVVQVVGRGTV